MRTGKLFLILGLFCAPLGAQSPKDRAENLGTCLSGKYPSLCRYELLSPEDLARARGAERLQNLETCLTGLYPSLCKHGLLSADETARVDEAERRENLKTCLTGLYPSLCKRSLLSPTEHAKVTEAERIEYLKTCLSGQFPSLCDHSRLSAEELSRAVQAEQTAAADKKSESQRSVQAPRAAQPCEEGHWIASISDDGEIVILDDRSIWEVDSLGTIASSLWLPYTAILVCEGRLINTDDNEVVSAERIEPDSRHSGNGRRFEVQAAIDDETFVINGKIFKAQTACYGISRGDEVLFVQGNASVDCATAAFVVLPNSEKCEVWCE